MHTDRTKIAFIKFGGLASGGSEKCFQALAANLPRDQFDVDYYYCDAAPYIGSDAKHSDTDVFREQYMKYKDVKLCKFFTDYKDVRQSHHPWVGTDFWEKFESEQYDIIQTVRAGHSEYPFTEISNVPQVDLITLPGMAERKPNVYKSVHISEFQLNTWVQAGGDPNIATVIPLFDDYDHLDEMVGWNEDSFEEAVREFRTDLGIEDSDIVFGFHQRNDDGIASHIPLEAFSKLEHDYVFFFILGGGDSYRQQAKELGVSDRVFFIDHTGNHKKIKQFLSAIDVYAHGRSDGETFSLSIAEALRNGLPIISHVAPAMGHRETIGDAGFIAENSDQYAECMKRLLHADTAKEYSEKAYKQYQNNLSTESCISKWIDVYKEIINQKQLEQISNDEFWENMWS